MNNTMNCDSEKSKPLTKEETRALLDLVEGSRIINNKATNATNNKLKTQEWIRLTELFNATATTCRRQPHQLRLKWENLKKNSRKRSTKIRMNNIQTGGGAPEYIPPDDILDRVASLLGSTVTGFAVPFGGDRDPLLLVSGHDSDRGESSGDGIGGNAIVINDYTVEGPDVQSIQNNIIVSECELHDSRIIQPSTTNQFEAPTTTKLRFDTPKTGKRKQKLHVGESSRSARDTAIAEYYTAKRQCVDAKFKNLVLQNEQLSLLNEKLKLENCKLKLEIEKMTIIM